MGFALVKTSCIIISTILLWKFFLNQMQVVDIPINKIRVINRMRKIDENNVSGLMTSIKEVNLLHPIQVAKQGDEYIL